MSFEERDVFRDGAGQFAEKDQTTPEAALATFQDITAEWALAAREAEEMAVAFLCANVPEAISTIRLQWSDSGNWVEVLGYVAAGGTLLAADGYPDDPDIEPVSEPDQELFSSLADAATVITGPFDRGIEDADSDGQRLLLHVTPGPKVTLAELNDKLDVLRAARLAMEEVMVDRILAVVPPGNTVTLVDDGEDGLMVGDAPGLSTADALAVDDAATFISPRSEVLGRAADRIRIEGS